MSAFSEAAEILDQIPLDASAPKHAPIPQLTMSPKEALAWAKAVDLNRVSAFTKMQKDEIAKVFIAALTPGDISPNRMALWQIPYMRPNTERKMEKAGFLETWEQARVRTPEDAQWITDTGVHSTRTFASPLGEQVAVALFLSIHGEEDFTALWNGGRSIRAAVLAERDRVRERNAIHKLREQRIREIASRNSVADKALRKAVDRYRGVNLSVPRNATIRQNLYEPMIQLTYDQLAEIMGEQLPKELPKR